MDHKEYRKASSRHLVTCKKILENLSTLKTQDKSHLLLNVYYLSGYIIETALSYAFFSHIKHSGNVENSEHYNSGFKTHNFHTKIKYISSRNGDLSSIPFIANKHQDAKLNRLFSCWSTDFRYCYSEKIKEKDLSEDLLKNYLTNVEQVLAIILRRY